jgi:hypothetical protein
LNLSPPNVNNISIVYIMVSIKHWYQHITYQKHYRLGNAETWLMLRYGEMFTIPYISLDSINEPLSLLNKYHVEPVH